MIVSSPSPACLCLPGRKSPLGRSECGLATGYHGCPPVFNTSPEAHGAVPLLSHGSGAMHLRYLKEGKGVDGVDGIDTGPGNTATRFPLCLGCLPTLDTGIDTLPRRRAINTLSAPSTHKPPPAPENVYQFACPIALGSSQKGSANCCPSRPVGDTERRTRSADATWPIFSALSRAGKHGSLVSDQRPTTNPLPDPTVTRPSYRTGGGGGKSRADNRVPPPLSPRRAPVSIERFLLGIHQP